MNRAEQIQAGPWEWKSADKEVMVMQVIKTTNMTRGDGINTPIRAITQFWSMDGDLLAEIDPLEKVVSGSATGDA